MEREKMGAQLKHLLETFEKNPTTLEASERAIFSKYKKFSDEAKETAKELKNLQDQIDQATQKRAQLEMKYSTQLGKSAGILELLFDEEPQVEASSPPTKPVPLADKTAKKRRRK